MKQLFLVFASLLLCYACTKSSPEEGETPTPDTKPQIPSISLDTTSLTFNEEGGTSNISFTSTTNWSAEAVNTRADSWISIRPTSGRAGNATITATVKPNDTNDERTASIVIKAGSANKTITVSQKQNDALTITTSKFEVSEKGGEVTIEVKANIDFEYTIDEAATEWISYKGTRAMQTSTLTFYIAENDDIKKREGKIYIYNGDFNEEITIYQAGEEPAIIISQDEYIISDAGETISVDVSSNIDVLMELPTDANWITENSTRSMSTNTYYFDIAPNEMESQRDTEIKFTNTENGLSETVKIIQIQKDAVVIAKESYTTDSESDCIEVTTTDNDIDFNIHIDCDWITIEETVTTRADTNETIKFDVAENTTNESREGTISFTSIDGEHLQEITITQNTYYNRIYYTTSDNKIVDYNKDANWEGAQIISNTYTNGQGIITFDKDITMIDTRAFAYCSTLTSISIPNKVTTIAPYAFSVCNNLTSVSIPSGMVAIEEAAFTYCSSLTNITIPDNVKTIGMIAFDQCSSLTSITLPNGLISIGERAFGGCKSLTSITIPNSVAEIGNCAFVGCQELIKFNSKFASDDGRCLIINNTLNSFAPAGLSEYTIPNSVTAIGEYAFSEMKNIEKINIPGSVTTIKRFAFSYCRGLTNITIPNSLEVIEQYAFYGCDNITNITIPYSVKAIKGSAFSGCIKLSTIKCESTTPPTLESSAFNQNASNRKILVPMESVDTYKTAPEWSNYKDFIEGYKLEAPNYSGTLPILKKDSVVEKLAKEFDRGGEGVGYHDLSGRNGGTPDIEGGGNIGYTSSGEWLAYTIYVEDAGTYKFTMYGSCSASAGTYSGEYQWFLDDPYIEENALGPRFKLQSSGGWGGPWAPSESVEFELSEGYQRIIFYMHNARHNIYKFTAEWAGTPYKGTLPILKKDSVVEKLAKEFDRGGEGVGYHDLSGRNGGTPDIEGGGNIGYTSSGEWLAYTIYVEDAGTYKFTMYGSCSASAGTYSGEYQWFLDDPYIEENALGPRFKLQSSGGWGGPWAPSESVEFELSEGYQRIIFYMHDARHNIYKFTAEWVE